MSSDADVQNTDTNILLDDVTDVSSKHEENEKISLSKPNDIEDAGKQGDCLEKATAETYSEVTGLKFVTPGRQQTAEDFDLRKFIVDVEQLVATLRMVVHRQAPEDFQGDNLAEMVSAVVGSMENFKTFASEVYKLLENVRDEMKSATDFMRQKILRPTDWDRGEF